MHKLSLFAAFLVLLGIIGVAGAIEPAGFGAADATDDEMTEECAEWMAENDGASMADCTEMMSTSDTMADCTGMMNENERCTEMMKQVDGGMGCH